MVNLILEYQIYYQKAGTKYMCGQPSSFQFVVENGIIEFVPLRGDFDREFWKQFKGRCWDEVSTEIVKVLRDSGKYSRIAIKEDGKRGYIYDWHMPVGEKEAKEVKFSEYRAKRKALMEQIKLLTAQVDELDKEWNC